MILLLLATFVFSAEDDDDVLFLEYGGKSKTCIEEKSPCHSLDIAVKHAKWTHVTDIAIQGHAELIGEVTFDSNADPFKKSPAEDIDYMMTVDDHSISRNADHYGLTGHGTIVLKGTSNAYMHLYLSSTTNFFHISTSRTPGGVKKEYVFRVEQYGILELMSALVVHPLEVPTTTKLTKLTPKFKTEEWDLKSAAIVVEKGALVIPNMLSSLMNLAVLDPELGVLILKDIDIEKSSVTLYHVNMTSRTSLVPKGVYCMIPNSTTETFNINIIGAGNVLTDWNRKIVSIEQYPLDFHFTDKCAAYDSDDKDKVFRLNKTDVKTIKSNEFQFPEVAISRSNLKMSSKSNGKLNDAGDQLLATFTSEHNSLNVEILQQMKVSIAPRYHTEEVEDKLIRWREMTFYVGSIETEMNEGGVTITQSGQGGKAVAAVPRAKVGISGEYTVKMEFNGAVSYAGCLYSGTRKTVAFASLAVLVAVLLGF
ncbi:hypothetical protein BLNAU_4994 [Blattamonas nauphoetae]|uniref:Uncharacterized protein n=1 Tax=Blattamonas nauphoetae TaxID=2049346 RepID=A0ABQ9Y8T1_9EUKA|nr:hypothetical protein BLNAU_4994 [Blattamonas nauphoetae]